jgi:lysophospholipase L1-like esterase
MAAGVRLVFETDSPRVDLRFEYLERPRRAFMVDAYVGGVFVASGGAPDAGPCEISLFSGRSGRREVELHMPPYSKVRLDALGIEANCEMFLPTRRSKRNIVFHGDSITHGAITTRAGLAYPTRVAQALDADFINLGFGGSARGEPGMARIIAGLAADAIILYYGINTFAIGKQDPAQFGEIYGEFIDIIRDAQPETPVVVITPTWHVPERHSRNEVGATVEQYREVIRSAAAGRIVHGDGNLVLLEGCSVIGPGDETRLADETHLNDEGFLALAASLVKIISRAWRTV